MPKAKILKCDECGATFIKPYIIRGRKCCPLCRSSAVGDVKELLLKTDKETEDAVLYKDDKTGKKEWVKRDPNEKIKRSEEGKEPPKEEIEQRQQQEKEQKRQSTYHKIRYKLKQAGKWTGSMKESLEALSDEEKDELLHG